MRVLLDTNVLVSAILFGGVPRRLLDLIIRGELQLVTSTALLDELEDVLVDKFGFSSEAANTTRSEIEAVADIARPKRVPRILRDPDDDQVLAAARSGRARAIVTGDRELLDLGVYGGIPIVSPADFRHEPGPG